LREALRGRGRNWIEGANAPLAESARGRNEKREFNDERLMASRFASTNDLPFLSQIANIAGCLAAGSTISQD
jgi:hypothetical protein